MTKHYHTYLALGDSYTIGEQLPLHDSFPYQALQLLRTQGLHFNAPEIVAKTGWTTFELAEHLLHTQLNEHYDFVSLLIGVNNQYRGLSASEFTNDFEFLLKKALHFVGNDATKVVVLSIPDWGVTPFAADRDTATIAIEIDSYNNIKKQLCQQHEVAFIDITTAQRADNSSEYVAADKLHPSALEYKKWATDVAAHFSSIIKG